MHVARAVRYLASPDDRVGFGGDDDEIFGPFVAYEHGPVSVAKLPEDAAMPNGGVGAITLISGCTVWADAVDGTLHSPTAIAGATTKAHRPQ
jgi:hypothetical protein